MESRFCSDEAATRRFGAELSHQWEAGILVLLKGDLGAGKTTFVRGVLEGLGYSGPVRSPTFNLMQVFETSPPIVHVDLYRARKAERLEIHDYLETHLVLVEWGSPELNLADSGRTWEVSIEWEGEGRRIQVRHPVGT